jgi:hypothetical protein
VDQLNPVKCQTCGGWRFVSENTGQAYPMYMDPACTCGDLDEPEDVDDFNTVAASVVKQIGRQDRTEG